MRGVQKLCCLASLLFSFRADTRKCTLSQVMDAFSRDSSEGRTGLLAHLSIEQNLLFLELFQTFVMEN